MKEVLEMNRYYKIYELLKSLIEDKREVKVIKKIIKLIKILKKKRESHHLKNL